MYKRDYYIVFTQAQNKRWWQIFTGNLSHVILITPCDDKSCMMISPSEGGMEVNYYKKSALMIALEAVGKGSTMSHKIVREYDMKLPRFKFFRTCVGIVKDFLGINKWWIITPGQLYNELHKEIQ